MAGVVGGREAGRAGPEDRDVGDVAHGGNANGGLLNTLAG
jgi:hypothetical protein